MTARCCVQRDAQVLFAALPKVMWSSAWVKLFHIYFNFWFFFLFTVKIDDMYFLLMVCLKFIKIKQKEESKEDYTEEVWVSPMQSDLAVRLCTTLILLLKQTFCEMLLTECGLDRMWSWQNVLLTQSILVASYTSRRAYCDVSRSSLSWKLFC